MFEEPEETPPERAADPAARAKEKSDEFRMHAELAAVFEGARKFEASIDTDFPADAARDLQRAMAKLEKSRAADTPLIEQTSADAAAALLKRADDFSTNDYHVYRRPGEAMIVRWLAGDEAETFYTRLQAHFDAALAGHKEDERQANEWKQDDSAAAYLTALDAVQIDMADRYLRKTIADHRVFILSTQTADEINIQYLCDYLMSVPVAEIVGEASAPPADPSEKDLAWFFKLFGLRGMVENVERMCFFIFLQKTDDSFDF